MVELKTQYKYIKFVQATEELYWWCLSNSDDDLGMVEMYPPWKQFCFFPIRDTLHSATCLDDIAAFLRQVNTHFGKSES